METYPKRREELVAFSGQLEVIESVQHSNARARINQTAYTALPRYHQYGGYQNKHGAKYYGNAQGYVPHYQQHQPQQHQQQQHQHHQHQQPLALALAHATLQYAPPFAALQYTQPPYGDFSKPQASPPAQLFHEPRNLSSSSSLLLETNAAVPQQQPYDFKNTLLMNNSTHLVNSATYLQPSKTASAASAFLPSSLMATGPNSSPPAMLLSAPVSLSSLKSTAGSGFLNSPSLMPLSASSADNWGFKSQSSPHSSIWGAPSYPNGSIAANNQHHTMGSMW